MQQDCWANQMKLSSSHIMLAKLADLFANWYIKSKLVIINSVDKLVSLV